ncbi:MAG: hypothetical protein L0I24_23460 [Pseudonocardia sp.]|nr:hypothetical protein [Pseudonocardia sp.]
MRTFLAGLVVLPYDQRVAIRWGESLAAYKRPRCVRFVDDLPKTSTGKIMRRELIKIFTA